MKNESILNILFLSVAVGIVLLCFSALIATIKMGSVFVTSFMMSFFQFLVTVGGLILVAAIGIFVVSWTHSNLVKRISTLESSYGEILQKINKRTPTFVTATALIASLVLLLVDKAFDGQTVPTVCVGVVLTLLFWIANELLVADSRPKNIFGAFVWLMSVLTLPAAIYIHYAGNFDIIQSEFLKLGLVTTILLTLALLVACVAPFALKRHG